MIQIIFEEKNTVQSASETFSSKLFAVFFALILLFPQNSSAFNSKISDKPICEKSYGVWREFGNGCADTCYKTTSKFPLCSKLANYACDCGSFRCWDPEENNCVSITSYQKKYQAAKAIRDAKEAEEEAARIAELEAQMAKNQTLSENLAGAVNQIPNNTTPINNPANNNPANNNQIPETLNRVDIDKVAEDMNSINNPPPVEESPPFVPPEISKDQLQKIEDVKSVCQSQSGNWRQFSDSCTDSCYSKKQATICAAIMTFSCDCGAGKCWDGSGCVPSSQ